MLSENSRHEKVGENRVARKSRYHEMVQRENGKRRNLQDQYEVMLPKRGESDFKYSYKRIEGPYYSDILHYSV